MSESRLYIRCVDRHSYVAIKPHEHFYFFEYPDGPEQELKPESLRAMEDHTEAIFEFEKSLMLGIATLRHGEHAKGKREYDLQALCCVQPGKPFDVVIFSGPPPETSETTIVRVHVYECEREGHPRRRYTRGGTVFANLALATKARTPVQPSSSDVNTISAPMDSNGIATFSVRSGALYEISVTTSEPHAGCHPKSPIPLSVGGCEYVDLEICLEFCHRMLMVLVADLCGKPVQDAHIKIDGHWHKSDASGQIRLELPTSDAVEARTLSVEGKEYDVAPAEISVIGDSLAQAVVLEVRPKGFGQLLVEVTDELGTPASFLAVQLEPAAGGATILARTDKLGRIRQSLPRGEYFMKAQGKDSTVAGAEAVAVTVTVQ